MKRGTGKRMRRDGGREEQDEQERRREMQYKDGGEE